MLRKKRKVIIAIVITNVLIAIVMVAVLLLYSLENVHQTESQNRKLVEQSTASISDAIILYFEQQQNSLLNRKVYIQKKKLSLQAAMDYLSESNNYYKVSYQIVSCDTLSGYSVKEGEPICDVIYSHSYKEIDNICKKIEENSVDDTLINATSSITSPLSGEQTIAFYTALDIVNQNPDKEPYMLLCVVPLDELLGSGLPTPPYDKAGGVIINEYGDFIVKTNHFSSENLFEFFRAYSNLGYHEAEAIKEVIYSGENGILEYQNSRNQECLYAYQKLYGFDQWY